MEVDSVHAAFRPFARPARAESLFDKSVCHWLRQCELPLEPDSSPHWQSQWHTFARPKSAFQTCSERPKLGTPSAGRPAGRSTAQSPFFSHPSVRKSRLGPFMLAYLVIREGTKWTDVFRLIPGQAATIGRAPTNQIVIKDERCSRSHAEVFHSQGQWILRDLESRNGTAVGSRIVRGDHVLAAGRHHSHRPMPIGVRPRSDQGVSRFASDVCRVSPAAAIARTPARSPLPPDDQNVLTDAEPTTITHRRGQTRFLEPTDEERRRDSQSRPGRCAALPAGVRVGQSTGRAARSRSWRWPGVFEATQVDAGALVAVAAHHLGRADRRTNWKSSPRAPTRELPYHRVSNFLASAVLREGEAVLARNVMDDSTLGSRDSKGEIHATSVLCASDPPRHKSVRADSSLFDQSRPAFPTPTIWNSRWPWPTPWRWRWKI